MMERYATTDSSFIQEGEVVGKEEKIRKREGEERRGGRMGGVATSKREKQLES